MPYRGLDCGETYLAHSIRADFELLFFVIRVTSQGTGYGYEYGLNRFISIPSLGDIPTNDSKLRTVVNKSPWSELSETSPVSSMENLPAI
jgi:hypothetical protein